MIVKHEKVKFQVNLSEGIANNICQESPSRKNCDNIYIWKKEREEFTTLSNESFARHRKNDLKALEGKTVRVAAHNVNKKLTLYF